MAATDVFQAFLLNLNYAFSILAIGVGMGGAAVFIREALKDHRRQAGPRLSPGDLECYSFLDE